MPIFPVVAGQVPISSDTAVAADPYSGGVRTKADDSAIFGATSGGVAYVGGLPVTATGQLVYVDATAGLPAGTQYINGLPMSGGAVCVSSGAVATWSNGLPFAANGALCAAAGSPAVTAAKSAAAAAPAAGSLQYQAQTVTYLGANAFPDVSFDRHYISGSGIGSADFATVTKPYFLANSWNSTGFTNNENDGSAALFWTAAKSMGTVQAWCPMYVGFQTPSRYIFVPSVTGKTMQVRVDGKLLPVNAPIAWPSNNNMAKIDLGTVGAGAGRKIVLQSAPDMWLAEVCVSAGSAVIPYDWQADATKVTAAFLGDSYQQGSDYSLVGLPFAQYMAELCGFGALAQSSIGNTGFLITGTPSTQYPNFQATERMAQITRENPTVVVVQGGINDTSGAPTNSAMAATFAAIRAALPTALIVGQTAWSPSQTAGQTGGGKWQLLRTNLYSVMAGLSGPWILIDNLAGQWSTSKGTNSGAGTGPWQTGDGNVSAPTGTGNGDTWVSADGTHPTPLGYKGLAELFATAYKAALASM